ncbi:MAG: low temperature requirement protein A [Oscillospiraceae bacterium]|nr:low temperature requirement protein A [Oscillospiraceae bacterium]
MEMKEEKKVEFIELIYDLIFVYLIGRNASLLDRIEDGFISAGTFVYYLVSSLIILQIWNYTTLFINRFGKNSFSDKVMLLINMFLLYIIGANTLHGWEGSYLAFMGAWCLILLNLAVQYLLKLRSAENELCRKVILQNVILLVLQAVIIGVSIPVHAATGVAFGQWAVLLSIAAVPVLSKIPTNFGHLTERVMLYVVFTFGEMVIIVAEYFADGLSYETLYFALASFLIVAGLFFSYGYVYDRLLDRSGERSGSGYMLLHVFIILSLSCVTTSMEFMRDPGVDSLPKTVMLVISLIVFYLGLALTEKWSYREYRLRGRFLLLLAAEFIVFAAAMILSAGKGGYLTAAIALAFVYIQLGTLLLSGRHTHHRGQRLI